MCKQMSLNSFKNNVTNKLFTYNIYICIYRIWYKMTIEGLYAVKPNNLT